MGVTVVVVLGSNDEEREMVTCWVHWLFVLWW